MKKCSANYNVELIPLAFDIVKDGARFAGETAQNIDSILNDALKSREFHDKLDKALRDYTAKVVSDIKAGKRIDVSEAKNTLKQGASAYGEAVQSSMLESPKATLIKQEAHAFKQTFECSPTGIWVDEHQTTLVVVGVLGVIGGVAYMYKHRTGDTVGTLSKDLLKKSWKVGSINLSTKVTNFKPSSREFGLQAGADTKWRQIKANLVANFLVTEKKLAFSSQSSITIPLFADKNLSLGMTHKTDNSRGLPAHNGAETKAFVNLEYKKDYTSMKIGTEYGADRVPTYILSMQINF